MNEHEQKAMRRRSRFTHDELFYSSAKCKTGSIINLIQDEIDVCRIEESLTRPLLMWGLSEDYMEAKWAQ